MSAHLQWMVLRNCSSFLVKRNKQKYSTEPSNIKAGNSFCYNGLIHQKTVAATRKGIVVMLTRRAGQKKPACMPRATLNSFWHMIRKNKYGQDLCTAALRRRSAILGSRKPVVVK
ncbi:60S ribosomal protein L28-like [Trichosurus vulpecula]|uniref:60S ribosomal protein L28-like n=1 Tax=Trichosurus vulpecula TaxID=9337 RepID=UPI00186B144B|nr:60S ribosomal protein L28-like [Trichosurus vulpecula]